MDSLAPAALAQLSCDGSQIVYAGSVVFHPARRLPAAPERAVLEAIGALLRENQEILLVQIQVIGGTHPGSNPESVRTAFRHTQQRADAIFRFLWRNQGVSAERLEPVGRGHDLGVPKADFKVRFRVVQRRDDAPPVTP